MTKNQHILCLTKLSLIPSFMRKRGRAPHYSLSLAIFLENLALPTFQRIYKIKVHLLPSGCGLIVVITS